MSTPRQSGQRREISPDERSALGSAPTLHSLLEGVRLVDAVELRCPSKPDGSTYTRVGRTLRAVVVLPQPTVKIDRAADVVGTVCAFDDVGPSHRRRMAVGPRRDQYDRKDLWIARVVSRLAGARTSTTDRKPRSHLIHRRVVHASTTNREHLDDRTTADRPGQLVAEPWAYWSNGRFQSPMPLVRVIGLSVPVYSTTSPIMLFSNSQPAFAVLMPVQPWLTLA